MSENENNCAVSERDRLLIEAEMYLEFLSELDDKPLGDVTKDELAWAAHQLIQKSMHGKEIDSCAKEVIDKVAKILKSEEAAMQYAEKSSDGLIFLAIMLLQVNDTNPLPEGLDSRSLSWAARNVLLKIYLGETYKIPDETIVIIEKVRHHCASHDIDTEKLGVDAYEKS